MLKTQSREPQQPPHPPYLSLSSEARCQLETLLPSQEGLIEELERSVERCVPTPWFLTPERRQLLRLKRSVDSLLAQFHELDTSWYHPEGQTFSARVPRGASQDDRWRQGVFLIESLSTISRLIVITGAGACGNVLYKTPVASCQT